MPPLRPPDRLSYCIRYRRPVQCLFYMEGRPCRRKARTGKLKRPAPQGLVRTGGIMKALKNILRLLARLLFSNPPVPCGIDSHKWESKLEFYYRRPRP